MTRYCDAISEPQEAGKTISRSPLTHPLKWHGGKHDLAKWIISLMPPRCKSPNSPAADDQGWLHYVEPYFGGGAVLLANDPQGISEVVNDKNKELTNFWNVLRSPTEFEMLSRFLAATPFSQAVFDGIGSNTSAPLPVDRAWRFFVRCRQSMSGRMKDFAPLSRNRTRRGMNEQASAWLNCIEGLPEVHERLKRVVILNADAIDVIRSQDGQKTLYYIDPPYMHETRSTTKEYGEFEMSYTEHEELLDLLGEITGKFLLSGYYSNLYDDRACLYGWKRHEMQINNHAASGRKKPIMTECVWTNY